MRQIHNSGAPEAAKGHRSIETSKRSKSRGRGSIDRSIYFCYLPNAVPSNGEPFRRPRIPRRAPDTWCFVQIRLCVLASQQPLKRNSESFSLMCLTSYKIDGRPTLGIYPASLVILCSSYLFNLYNGCTSFQDHRPRQLDMSIRSNRQADMTNK